MTRIKNSDNNVRILILLRHHTISRKLFFLAVCSLLLSGCAGLVRAEQSSTTSWVTLSAGQIIGQTFVARFDGLSGIYFNLSPQEISGTGEIRLHLRTDPQSETDLAVSTNSLSLDQIQESTYYGFFISPQASSNKKSYYAFLELKGPGEIQVATAAGKNYINGALYQNGMPVDEQAAFQLSYSRQIAILGLVREVLNWAGLLTVGLFLFVLPGWGLLTLCFPGWNRLNRVEKLALSAGLSLAIYPLFFLWTGLINLHLGFIYAWLPPIVGVAMIAWKNRYNLKFHSLFDGCAQALNRLTFFTAPPDLGFIVLAIALIFTRFWAIRSLDFPMALDSYHHSVIAQLLVDHKGLFTSWQPYALLTTFTYHFGFHADVAVFHWITLLDIPTAVLYVGQILNILAVISLYPLTMKIIRSRWAGIVTVLVAGFLSPMPMYYTNWGRYTQLAGQVILPVVVWILWTLLDSNSAVLEQGSKGLFVVGSIALGGLALTHYRILILAMIFLATLWVLYARRATLSPMILKTIGVGLPAALLFLPWFIRVFGGRILNIFVNQMSASAAKALEADPPHSGAANISFFLPYTLWIISLLIMCIGAWRRDKGAVLIGFWWFANFLAANPSWLGLPGSGALSNDAISMAVYIPAAILVGTGFGWLEKIRLPAFRFQPFFRAVLVITLVILVIGCTFWGARLRLKDVQPSSFALIVRPDISAMAWIRTNTPPEARFLTNSFVLFNSVVVGSDGGYWLPYLANRQDVVPPLAYGFERDPWPGYSADLRNLTLEIQTKGIRDPDVLFQLQSRGISYIYIGQLEGQGNTNFPLLTPEQLLSDSSFQPVYHQDRVWIFKVP